MTAESRSPFDPPIDEMRAMGHEVVELAARFIEDRYSAPTSDYSGVESLLNSLSGPPAEGPTPLVELLETIEGAAAKGFDPANPGMQPPSPISWPASSIATPACRVRPRP